MSSGLAFPYRTVPEELCELSAWERFDPQGNSESVGDSIAGWDYDSQLDLGRTIKFHPKSVVKSLGLNPQDASISVVVTAETALPVTGGWFRAPMFQTLAPGQMKFDSKLSRPILRND
jgi:hypothetical protein